MSMIPMDRLNVHLSRNPVARACGAPALLALFVAFGSGVSCKTTEASDAPEQAPAVHVETAPVTEIDVPVTLRFTGTLKGMQESDLAANTSGRVQSTTVERGSEVEAGSVIAKIDTSAASLSLLEAKVQVATSKTQNAINDAECARYEKLRASGAISPLEYDQTTAKCKTAPLNLEAAQARQNIAAKNVGDGTIRAPFAGVISERYVSEGEYVQPSSKVVSIAQIGELRLEFTVPEANFRQVKVGSEVSFTVAAYEDKSFSGAVRFVSGAVRASTRDLVVEAVIANEDRLLRPGMFADVSLTVGNEKLPSVPVASVFEGQEKKRVFVVADGRLSERVLHPGQTVDKRLSVKSGVSAGELVVIGDISNLKNGDRVE